MVIRAPLLLAGALGAPALALAACAQLAGVEQVSFYTDARAEGAVDATTSDALPGDARDGAHDDAGDGDALDTGCGSCTLDGAPCCSPHRCSGGVCCGGTTAYCLHNSDCCSHACDVDATRCLGPCIKTGQAGCGDPSECCDHSCTSTGVCGSCKPSGGSCTDAAECCIGLTCTASEGGFCEML